jgi:hypothetical protein
MKEMKCHSRNPKKRKTVWRCLEGLLCVLLGAAVCWAGDRFIMLDEYREGLSPRWEEKSFSGRTRYTVATEDGILCLLAESRASASALIYKIEYDPKAYPFLHWRWKVEHALTKGDEKTKQGDDYSARVYVVFPSFLFWKTRALNYIWANKLTKGDGVPNPFTANAVMIAVQSGPAETGKWIEERRNILEDFRRFFGEDPPKAGAVAIMTDTDNTGESAKAWYGPIWITANGSGASP